MLSKIQRPLSCPPYLFVYLLPLFFVFHVSADNSIFPTSTISFIILEYTAVITLLIFLIKFVIQPLSNRLLFVGFIVFVQLFFGPLHDFLKSQLPNTFFIKYTFIIPFLFFLFVFLFFYLKNTKQRFLKLPNFITSTLLLLCFIEILRLVGQANLKSKPLIPDTTENLETIVTKEKPDIFLIIADEYAGSQELIDIFGFNNHIFLDSLKKLGFRVIRNSKSNYNHTVYSMASMLNLNYINNLKFRENPSDFFYCIDKIKESKAITFLKKNGYVFQNLSIFEIAGQSPLSRNSLNFRPRDVFLHQTLLYRSWGDIGFNFFSEATITRIKNLDFYSNNKIESSLIANAKQKADTPRVIYAHIQMPHHPYYFDSVGNVYPSSRITENSKYDKLAYLNNLKFTNKKLLRITNTILENSLKPPIILLMSDHGFRQFKENGFNKYYFMNLNAIYLPSKNYKGFYDGMSNVNQFRVLLNSEFNQNLSLLKDTSFFIWEK